MKLPFRPATMGRRKKFTYRKPLILCGHYVEWTRVGNLLYLSGHGPPLEMRGKGKVGKDLTLEQGREAAREAGLA